MRFQTYLEAFDNPYDYDQAGTQGTFTVDGDKYVMFFKDKTQKLPNGKTLQGIEFGFEKNGSTIVSKSKEPFRIFATVLDFIKTNIKGKDYLEFSADNDEPSKKKLYKRLAGALKKELKWKYLESDEDFGVTYYSLYKKKPKW